MLTTIRPGDQVDQVDDVGAKPRGVDGKNISTLKKYLVFAPAVLAILGGCESPCPSECGQNSAGECVACPPENPGTGTYNPNLPSVCSVEACTPAKEEQGCQIVTSYSPKPDSSGQYEQTDQCVCPEGVNCHQ